MLQRIGSGAARHHWIVIGVWLLVAVAAITAAGTGSGLPTDSFSVPGADSQRAISILEERFPAATAGSATVVFTTPGAGNVTDPAAKASIDATVANLKALDNVSSVADPFAELPAPLPRDISPDGRIAYTTVTFTEPATGLPASLFGAIEAATEPARDAGLAVSYSGSVVDLGLSQPSGKGGLLDLPEEIGLLFAVVILMVAMGSVVAMVVPIGSALLGVVVSSSLLTAAMAWFTIGSVVPAVGMMIGLGVGIDYALFITGRFRQNLADGDAPVEAAGRASATAGSAVLFAGMTVCLALVGLALVGIPYVTTIGLAAAGFVVVAVAAALTLIPALLGVLGHRVNSLRIHRHDEGDGTGGFSHRWAQWVVRRPVPFAVVGVLIMLVLTVPLVRIEMAFPSAADNPPGNTERVAYDTLAEGFGPGVNGPLLVVIELPTPTSQNAEGDVAAALALVKAIGDTQGVSGAVGPIPNSDGTVAIISVTPDNGPASPETKALVATLRADTIPTALNGTSIEASQVSVGGQTATLIDLTDLIDSRLPWFIGGVVAASFLLLMMVFRSLLVPLKAAIMNLLSIGAAYGVLVAVFQWGWMRSLIGLEQPVPVAPIIPVMMFAILFGLSMDYEVFLLSRMREEWQRTGDAMTAVVNGMARTARVITAAALIMISVFGSFVLNPNPMVKMIGFGMAVAVLVDASIVRMILVPAVMRLFGPRAWWLPVWLERFLPHISIDAAPPEPPGPDSHDEPPTPVGATR
jgi:putative drug exporter of the RND superfamily